MALTGRHVGGRPTLEQDRKRDFAETAFFQIGEERNILADLLLYSRQSDQAVASAEARVERQRIELDEALKDLRRARHLHENRERLNSLRLRDLNIQQEHLIALAEAMGIDKLVQPALEVIRS